MILESKWGSVYYEDHGGAQAPVLVFCHGVSMDHRTFDAQVHHYAKTHRVIVWDYPGHGQSAALDPGQPFCETAARILWALLDHLHIQEAVLAGQSLGSAVIQLAATDQPVRVQALVHISGLSLYPPVSSSLRLLAPLVSPMIALYPSGRIYRTFARHRSLLDSTAAYMEEVSAKNGKQVMSQVTKALLRTMVRGLDAPLPHPALICTGEHEMKAVHDRIVRWGQRAQEGQLAVIPDAHHILNMDNPERFHRVLDDFLNALEKTSSP